MAILEKEVWVGLGGNNPNYYENLGYNIPRIKNNQGKLAIVIGTKILVNIKDLPINSKVKVTKICDECNTHMPNIDYNAILLARKNGDGLDRCHSCNLKKMWLNIKNNIPYERSFQSYTEINDKKYLLEEYSEKNIKKPYEISYGTTDYVIWNCPDCKSEYEMKMFNRVKGHNCPYCAGQKINEKNCLWTTHPEIAKLLKYPQRGYEINGGRNKKEIFVCSNCGFEQLKAVNNVVIRGKVSCPRCSDGISYPEKFMINFLEQLELDFNTQKIFDWSQKIYHLNPQYEKLTGMKKFDFYIPSLSLIIETHGQQHYNVSFEYIGGRTQGEEVENDDVKKFLALNNGIKRYIIIDCRKSELEWIKNKILESRLNGLLDLTNIDWLKCHESACKSLVKEVCELWNKGIRDTLVIGNILNLNRATIIKYLKQGNELNWIYYNTNEILKNKGFKLSQNNKRKIIQLSKENSKFIKVWNSIGEAEKSLGITNVSAACRGTKKSAGGFRWMYKSDYDQLQKTK